MEKKEVAHEPKASPIWDWIKPFLPLLQAALSAYLSTKMIKKTAEHAKSAAVRGSVVGFGSLSLLAFFVASIIMTFVDLGSQFESHNEIHFSGMMLAALYLTGLGLLVFGICYGISALLASKERQHKVEDAADAQPYAKLIALGEEALKQWVAQHNQK